MTHTHTYTHTHAAVQQNCAFLVITQSVVVIFMNVSIEPVGPVFRGQAEKKAGSLSRNFGKKLPLFNDVLVTSFVPYLLPYLFTYFLLIYFLPSFLLTYLLTSLLTYSIN